MKKVGIIYSPGFGAGWSTWNEPSMALDQELAHLIYSGNVGEDGINRVAKQNWPRAYLGGLDNAVVQWVDEGTEFFIDEYDGAESIIFRDDEEVWIKATTN